MSKEEMTMSDSCAVAGCRIDPNASGRTLLLATRWGEEVEIEVPLCSIHGEMIEPDQVERSPEDEWSDDSTEEEAAEHTQPERVPA